VHDLVSDQFTPGDQHDAHELLRTIFDMMKKDQTKVRKWQYARSAKVTKTGQYGGSNNY